MNRCVFDDRVPAHAALTFGFRVRATMAAFRTKSFTVSFPCPAASAERIDLRAQCHERLAVDLDGEIKVGNGRLAQQQPVGDDLAHSGQRDAAVARPGRQRCRGNDGRTRRRRRAWNGGGGRSRRLSAGIGDLKHPPAECAPAGPVPRICERSIPFSARDFPCQRRGLYADLRGRAAPVALAERSTAEAAGTTAGGAGVREAAGAGADGPGFVPGSRRVPEATRSPARRQLSGRSGHKSRPRIPSSNDSISIVALSVSISAMMSPTFTLSPVFLSHRTRVPSVMVSASFGIWIAIDISANRQDFLYHKLRRGKLNLFERGAVNGRCIQ